MHAADRSPPITPERAGSLQTLLPCLDSLDGRGVAFGTYLMESI
jgi:hypothetical protein